MRPADEPVQDADGPGAAQAGPGGYRSWQVAARGGAVAQLSTDPDVPWLDAFYGLYDRAFALPEEKESLAGFRDCLALNGGAEGARLRAEFGGFCEVVMRVTDQGGAPVAGANFTAFRPTSDAGTITVNLNYAFVAPACRGQGWLRELVAMVRDQAGALMGDGGARILIFVEQNDPLRLSEVAYRRDRDVAGLDPWDRLRIWHRMGARLVDFDYRQPPLSPGQEADMTLVYGVLGPAGDGIGACLLLAHLRAFFAIAVLKGRPIAASPVASHQVAALEQHCRRGAQIAVIDHGAILSRPPRTRARPGPQARSLLELARGSDPGAGGGA